MYAKKIKIASLIITHNRVNEAKAQMDIIRELWEPMFASVDIYHEFNGKVSWYPKKYKEDFLHRHKKMSHFVGANYLLNKGFKHVLASGKKYDLIIATSSDTWFYDSKKLKEIVLKILRNKFAVAASLWGGIVFSTEFFILTPELSKKVFPMKFNFIHRSRPLKWTYNKLSFFESLFTFKVMQVLKNPNKIYLIPGRRTIWLKNRFWSPNFYASHHDPMQRKKDISPKIRKSLGEKLNNMPSLNRFL